MQIHNVEQKTKEWFDIRKGKMTASKATAIGNAGKGLETYIYELMAEYYSSADKEQFSSSHTDRGNEYEPVARDVYSFENGVDVETVGFIELSEYVGCSPDGLVGDDGGTEIKSPDDKKYILYLLNKENEIDSGYIWQCQMNMLITDRKWWDLIIYNPNFEKSMLVFRIHRDLKKFEALKKGFEKGEVLIKSIKERIENNG